LGLGLVLVLQPTEISNEQSQVQLGRRLTRYFCQPKMVTLSTVIVVLTLFLSSVFVNEQAASSSTVTAPSSSQNPPFCGGIAVMMSIIFC
jgi:hypothetical protein